MSRSGRGGMGARPYRRARAEMLAEDDICAICGHPGSMTADHIITDAEWPRDAYGKRIPEFMGRRGFDSRDNLQPAHGTMQPGVLNRCPVCSRLCNQSRGRKSLIYKMPSSREW